ncbi:MAG: hypothetical protein ACOCW6_07545 [Spirochaetota bacterium]
MRNRLGMMRRAVFGTVLALLLLLYFGCDPDAGGTEADGTLTVSIEGFDSNCGLDAGRDPYLIAWVMETGAEVVIGGDTSPRAAGFAQIVDGVASAEARVFETEGEGPPETQWKGTGGSTYDVYPTVYCITSLETFDPVRQGPDWFHGASDFSAPITYTQDGD